MAPDERRGACQMDKIAKYAPDMLYLLKRYVEDPEDALDHRVLWREAKALIAKIEEES